MESLARPGWLERQRKINKKQLSKWPKWMKRDVIIPRKTPTRTGR
jgi:hypothetical protein